MDSKEIKTTLKNAREAISKKEYEVAIEHCQTVLEADSKNYNALVFLGVANDKLEKNEDAVKAYQKATEVNPDQLLAWQGLCGFYEKNQVYVRAYKNNLVTVYEKLIELYKNDAGKKLETMKRLAAVLCELESVEKCIQVNQDLLELISDDNEKLQIKQALMKLLESHADVNTELLYDCYESCLESEQVTFEEKEAVLKKYLSLILLKVDREKREEKINKLMNSNPSSVVLQEHIVLIFLERCIEQGEVVENSELREKMSSLESVAAENNAMLKTVQGYFSMVDKKFELALPLLSTGKESYPNFAVMNCLLAYCNLQLRNNQACIQYVSEGLQLLKCKKKKVASVCCGEITLIERYLRLLQCEALCNVGDTVSLQQAKELLSKMDKTMKSQVVLCRVYMKEGKSSEAMEILETLECDDGIRQFFLAWVDFQRESYKEAYSRLETLCATDQGGSEAWCLMGKSLWKLLQTTPDGKEKEQKCYTTLLKAAQLDPKNGEPFLYLGHFYANIRKDNSMAKKCYDKAFKLDSTLDEAGAATCDLMTSLGDQESAYNLLLKVTREAAAGSAKWAWLRLGLCQIKQDNPIAAITSFQSALRADFDDMHVWECLAEAYFHRGSYTAALKAFTKASELNPDSLYCKYQKASIRQTLNMYVEAIQEYKDILEISSNYVPALKGLGETNILLGRTHLTQNLDGRVKDNCQDALFYLTKAASERPEMSCLWKLLGDACMLVQYLNCEDLMISVPKKLLQKIDEQSDEVVVLPKRDVIQLSTRCYGRALKVFPENSMLWHDLGVAFYVLSKLTTETERQSLLEKAEGFMKKAVSLDSVNYRHWNALGVISASKGMNKPSLAQHCFIKSVQSEANNVVAWTNLGVLYLQHDNVNLAHEAFKVAQSLDPSYVSCWIGQAMIAETVGHDDTMDLYRHTTELAYHPEGSIGYAHWVCSMLQDQSKHNTDMFQFSIKEMAAIPSASDTLARYLERHGNDTTALNMYGLLLEQQTFYTSASTVLNKCVNLLTEEEPTDESKLNKARLNLARVLCKLNMFEDSVKVYKQTTSIEQAEDLCNYGFTLYKAGEYAESYKAYEKAAELVSSEEDKSHIYAALGMVAYKFGDMDGAKGALFKSSQVTPASIVGLKALCALGLLQSDMTLVTAVLQELFKQEDNLHTDTTWLTVAKELVQGNYLEIIKFLQRSLHSNPKLYQTWMILAEVLLKYFPERGTATTNCVKIAEKLNAENNGGDSKNLLTLAQLQAGQHSRVDGNQNSIITAQTALSQNPGNVRNWMSLIASIHCEACIRRCVNKDVRLYKVELRYLNHLLDNAEEVRSNTKLKLWCCKQKIICLIETEQLQEAKTYLQQIKEEMLGNGFQSAILNLINGTPGKFVPDNTEDSLYVCQTLVETYVQQGLIKESTDLLRQYLSTLTSSGDLGRPQKLIILLQTAHICFKNILEKNDTTMKQIFDDSIAEILRLDPNNIVALVMKAAVFLGTQSKDEKRAQMFARKFLTQSYLLYQSNVSSSLGGMDYIKKHLIKLLQASKKEEPLLEELLKNTLNDKDNQEKE